ncbi:MAG: hypothetical protein ACE5HJ_09690, partial [Thermoplasmata archaeon]
FQSELYHRLNQTDGLTAGPLLENAKVIWRDIGKANEDALHTVINAGFLADEDWSTLAYMALKDIEGNAIAAFFDVTTYMPLIDLPTDALSIIPWAGATGGPAGTMSKGFRDWLGSIGTLVVTTFLDAAQLIYDGLVALGTFLVNLAEAIWEWGTRPTSSTCLAVGQLHRQAHC